MRFLENSFKFFGKYIIFAIPLFVIYAIQSLMVAPGLEELSIFLESNMDALNVNNPEFFEELITQQGFPELDGLMSSSIIVTILLLFVMPATYGIINRIYSNGSASFGDFFIEMKNNVLKYFLYILALIVFYIVIGLIVALVSMILGIVAGVALPLAILFGIMMFFGIIILFVFVMNVTVMGFTAVVTDKIGVFGGISKAMSVVKSYFWPIIGITLLISVGSTIASVVVMFVPITQVALILSAALSAIVIFIFIVFTFEVYRDKTEKNVMTKDDIPDASEYM
ncbi:hypothetical protein RBH29_12945 [Herbivorax sp. ANBcel31]|uniref:hypothetical protein n=1 Tax=Herbivorax sp. ANBcel31 TaxID=3069754 RepID=UPI0027B35865|nr:hypothetical protein [Herbivorax sp. ANBcel31]MDQ2087333.1 hypothetical protein [Herbivorax sp. ANBcel31]